MAGLRLLPRPEEERQTVRLPAYPTSVKEQWPDAVACREAVQNPSVSLADPLFAGATVTLDRRGLPLTYTGRFAAVFRVTLSDGTAWAVRCFTSAGDSLLDERAARYGLLEAALRQAGVSGLFAPFRYLPQGFHVAGRRYPLLAMPWIEGESLGRFVEKHRANPAALLTLARTLGEALRRLDAAGIAHGDWQHDNLLIADGGRRVVFVDYDGVFVPDLAGFPPPSERGHPNYQHPLRTDGDYGPELDRFPCLLIQTALASLAAEPSLWDSFSDGESLVFSRTDLEAPAESNAFATVRLVSHAAPEVGDLLSRLEAACRSGVAPAPVEARLFETMAQRMGVILGAPQLDALTTPSLPTARAAQILLEDQGESEEEKAEKRRSFLETVSISAEARRWFEMIRNGLQKQKTLEMAHLWTVRAFYLALAWWVWYWPHPDPDPAVRFFMSLFIGPAGSAFGYFLWPRNLEGIELTDALERNTASLEINLAQLEDVSRRLRTINRNPANLSAIVYVAAALQAVRLDDPVIRQRLGLSAYDLTRLAAEGIERLSDLPATLPVSLDAEMRHRLYGLKVEVMDAARGAYARLSDQRREMQQDRDRLEAERQGLVDTDNRLRAREVKIGSGSFGRFLTRVVTGF